MTKTLFLRSCVISALCCAAVGCAGAPEPEQVTTRVDNAALGISIAALPEPFEVVANEGSRLELQAPGEAGPGVLVFEVSDPAVGGVNLVAEAESMRSWFEGQPDGQYFGNLELVTPLGTAYTARGSYRAASGTVEELRVFALHPTASRLLRLIYSYPPGEGKVRMQQLAEVLGEIEALAQEASSSGADS